MIHPRRLKGTPANIARYYTVGDYYTKGADEHNEWGGAIATELGLSGPVDPAVFKALLAGRVGDQQLGRHRSDGTIDHHPGWDFAVNAPKSVSIMALLTGDEQILAAHERAVGAALDYLEEHATLRRRQEGEIVHETTGRLLFARFTEHASRELDPHLHTHVVTMNMTNQGPGSSMVSLETRAMFAEQMTAGQVYRNALAFDLREQGWGIADDPRTGLFEIRGVPHDLIRQFSKRAEQIDAHAEEHGLEGQAARREAFYATRPRKEKISEAALRTQWTTRSAPHREVLDELSRAARDKGGRDVPIEPGDAARATLFGLRQAETREAVNNRGRIIRLGLASHVGDVRLSDMRPLLAEHEERQKLLVATNQTGDQILTRGRTSRATARREQGFARQLALALDDGRAVASTDRLLQALEGAGLKPAQEQALVDIAIATDRVTAIHGVAGSGKSTLIRVLARAAGSERHLIALAPTSSAAADLGDKAGIEHRTVANLLASGGRGLTPDHVLVLDEAGQLGNRQAARMLELSRDTGARLILLGDNKQTGAIEQGKAFWLLQRLGMPTAELAVSVRQETRTMKAAVTEARAGNYAASLAHLDKIYSGRKADELAGDLVGEWMRLKPETRSGTNILVLDNATRLIINTKVRAALKKEGVVATEEARLPVLTPAGMTDEEQRFARFYVREQVVTFARDDARTGVKQGTEYHVTGFGRDANGRQLVKLEDELGREHLWDPRRTAARQINVFRQEERALGVGDRVQWRLVTRDLGLKNAERGTVERMDGALATIRWDRGGRQQEIDLSRYKTWDHGYAETIYSAQSKTYARAYILAPVYSGLVTGQNYYTAITRARLGVKLWTENPQKLAERLKERSGEKTASLEGLGRLEKDHFLKLGPRQSERLKSERAQMEERRRGVRDKRLARQLDRRESPPWGPEIIADRARSLAETMDRYLRALLDRPRPTRDRSPLEKGDRVAAPESRTPDRSRGPER